jgi:hypothetical protein
MPFCCFCGYNGLPLCKFIVGVGARSKEERSTRNSLDKALTMSRSIHRLQAHYTIPFPSESHVLLRQAVFLPFYSRFSSMAIPIIDVSQFFHESAEARSAFAKQLVACFREYGAVRLHGNCISPCATSGLFDWVRRLYCCKSATLTFID